MLRGWAAAAAMCAAVGCGFVTGSDSVSTGDFSSADMVECRKLGGGSVFVEYEKDGAGSSTVVEGVPKPGEMAGMSAESGATNPRKRKAQRANGWTEQDVTDLITMPDDNEMARNFGWEGQSDAQIDARRAELRAKLDRMPSCLEQAQGDRPTEG